jgi:hypothetical protein
MVKWLDYDAIASVVLVLALVAVVSLALSCRTSAASLGHKGIVGVAPMQVASALRFRDLFVGAAGRGIPPIGGKIPPSAPRTMPLSRVIVSPRGSLAISEVI